MTQPNDSNLSGALSGASHAGEAEHIQESTLVPHSHFVLPDSESVESSSAIGPSESVDVVPPTSSTDDAKPMARALGGESPSALKNNLPYIAVAGLGVLIAGAYLLSGSRTGPAPAPAPAVAEQQAEAPKPKPSAPVAAVEINNAALPGSVAATNPTVVQPAVVVEQGASAPLAVVPTGPAVVASGPAAVVVTQDTPAVAVVTPTTQTPAVAVVTPPAQTVAVVTPAVDPATASQVSANRADISDLKTRVAALEGKTPVATSGSQATEGSEHKVAQKKTASSKKRVHRVAKSQVKSSSHAWSLRKDDMVGDLKVHMMRSNLVWLQAPNGTIRSFMVGEVIPGIGRVTVVNEASNVVQIQGVKAVKAVVAPVEVVKTTTVKVETVEKVDVDQ